MKYMYLHKSKNNNQQRGFTIVELLIAMAVFQVVLVIALMAYLSISRYYQKTINANRLQQTANGVVDDISRSIQNTGGLVSGNFLTAKDIEGVLTDKTDTIDIKQQTMTFGSTVFNVICVDNTRYAYRFNVAEQSGGVFPGDYDKHVFMSDTVSSPSACLTTTVFGATNPRLLLSPDMQLYGFAVVKDDLRYTVNINVAYTSDPGDIDLSEFTAPSSGYISCKGGSGRQYCSVSNVSTTVVRRIGL